MPDEYISRKAALKDFEASNADNPRWTPQRVKTLLIRQPAADVAPVVHGRWVDGKCSNCGVDIPTDDSHDAIFENECHFCYYCGAKMGGGNS